jgi:glycosyltransferase involved in cell wall biosynthesis
MGKKKYAVVSVTNDLLTDNRVDKVCLFLMKQGFIVTLVGRRIKSSQELKPRLYKTKRFKLIRENGPIFYAAYNLRLFFYLLFHRADLLVSNDLDTLLANYCVSKFKPGARLVYDSHEYFTEVPELVNRPKVQKIWERIEHWIFPKLQTIYTVNESIAEMYHAKYKKEVKVIRNVSPAWQNTGHTSKSELGIPEDTFLIIMQGAGINVHRGAEEAVEAMKFIENATLLIVGDGDVVSRLKQYVIDYVLEKKVLFFSKRPYNEMMEFTSHADVGLTLDKPNNLNYKFSLPNKVFDYIHAGTPIISTKLIELERIITKHKVGLLIEDLTPENLAEKINFLKSNRELLNELKANCKIAAKTENWENESLKLAEIYSNFDK